jgi:hypothetical protein
MKNNFPVIISILLILLQSCFPEDEFTPLKPFKGIVGTTANSIYLYQSYYLLSDSLEVSNNLNNAWDLGFDASENGAHVILNSADLLYIANLGTVDFESTTTLPDSVNWVYDASSGNIDSLAVNHWIDMTTNPYTYSQNVFVIAQKRASSYTPIKKFKLIELTNTYYKLLIDIMPNSEPDTVIIEKNPVVNYVGLSLREANYPVTMEPNKDQWDILFTQYASIILDDNGIPYPYLLRGALINSSKIKVARYYITTSEVPEIIDNNDLEEANLQEYFENQMNTIPKDSDFKTTRDIIGWEWKEVTVDEQANTAIYKADTRRIFFIKDNDGTIYKLRFFSYKSVEGENGFPWLQYIPMN